MAADQPTAGALGGPDPLTAVFTADTAGGAPGSANAAGNAAGGTESAGAPGTGTEGEQEVWSGRYSLRSYTGRIFAALVLTAFWIYVATYNDGEGRRRMSIFANTVGVVTLIAWVILGFRMLITHYGRQFRLTNRRLFHAEGILRHRQDQMELLHVKDVFTRQDTILQRIMGIGTVVVVSNDAALPTFYFNGVANPKQLMDLIWHHTRAEREKRSVEVADA